MLTRPTINGSDSDSGASDGSLSDEGTECAVQAKEADNSHRKQPSGNGPSVLPKGGLNKTSMLALQVNELLSETRPNHKRLEASVAPTVQRITEIIQQIPARPPALLKDAEKTFRADSGICIPFIDPRPAKDSKYKFEYQTPESIEYHGAVGLQLVANSSSNIFSIAVQMPEALFQEKDYLNQRAFHKRAFYLACIAAGLRKDEDSGFNIVFQAKDDLALVPVIVVTAGSESSEGTRQSNVEIQIAVTFPPNSIPIDKTHPGKNCLRLGEDMTATPLYNSCARSLASLQTTQALLHDSKRNCTSFADTGRIASIWLRQRGFGSSVSQGGFGSEEWNLLCALLLHTGGHNVQPLLSSRYTTVQLFKVVLQFLAMKDLTSPMVVRSTVQLPQTNTPVLYDGVTGVNLFFKMTSWSYQALRDEAAATLAATNARNEDNFDSIFIVRSAEHLHKFDEVYQVEVAAVITTQKAYDILAEGLGDRVKRVSIDVPSDSSWQITERRRSQSTVKLSVGLILAPELKERLVDHGPTAEEQEEAAKFRAFWGEKAELRRFKDGSIVESLVWSEDESPTLQIIKYLAARHFDVQASSIISLADQADNLMLDQDSKLKSADAFKLLRNAYQTLTTQLHSLEEMPLRIRSITPANGQLSSSSLTLPLSSPQSSPASIYIEFENSTRWPDHLPAIQQTKIAFLLKLGEVLQAAHPEYTTRIGLENTDTASSGHANTSYLDIVLPTSAPGLPPLAFRLRIMHDREITLTEKALSSKTLSQPAQITMSHALQAHKRSLAAQRHTTMLNTLTTRFPALSSTIRLLKKWTASHMLPPSLLPDQLLDLLCIHTFTSPYPWSLPGSAQTAFLRTLHTLSRWDWASEPLLVDTSLDGSLFSSATDVENLRTRFTAWRKLDPMLNNVILYVGSNLDNTGVVWTQGQQPPQVVAGRLTALAKASVAAVREKELNIQKEDWRGLFQSSLSDFDFLIHLKRGFGRGGEKKGAGKFKNLQLQEEMDTDAIGFDAVGLFVKDLEETFEQSSLFFYDRDGGKVIAGLWNPRAMQQQGFRVRLGVSSMPVAVARGEGDDEKVKVVVNQAGILAEIAMMGEGLVQKIEVLKDFV
jgi:U3 small nucleolar RNA-associated protein 22